MTRPARSSPACTLPAAGQVGMFSASQAARSRPQNQRLGLPVGHHITVTAQASQGRCCRQNAAVLFLMCTCSHCKASETGWAATRHSETHSLTENLCHRSMERR